MARLTKPKVEVFSLYNLRRTKNLSDDTLIGPTHGSDDGDYTLCGLDATHARWYICNNTHDGVITCKKCLAKLRSTTPGERAEHDAWLRKNTTERPKPHGGLINPNTL